MVLVVTEHPVVKMSAKMMDKIRLDLIRVLFIVTSPNNEKSDRICINTAFLELKMYLVHFLVVSAS